ncbi:MAG: AbrB/MazE/SpoVT family DNA-binding domain-containing protein [Candidatus Eremiobacteraeota bacterium]|nr:AbrB/MazE/SpoVT family DNA-binding domain-containing protein [Candidatus Eremiobacteraeota bacterium]
MKTQLAMWGNSLAVRIPRALAEELSLMKGVEVDLQVEDGRLVVVPTRRPRYELCDLVREITDENRHPQLDWGEARGEEAW